MSVECARLDGVDRPLLLVDTPGLYFRAFFGIPEGAARAPDGSSVSAVRGTLDMLSTLIRTRRPDRLVCAFDEDWRPAWRVALIPSYKTHRLAEAGVAEPGAEQVPDPLARQVPTILELLAAFGIPAVGATGYEADDVLGTLATREPAPVEVVSGDRDLFQLVDDDRPVRVLYTGRGVANLQVFDDVAVRARFGVPAALYPDYAALRGDPSDGLPGVAGIGEKTAARLIDRYGGLDGILAALPDPKAGFAPGLRAKLAESVEYLAAAPRVVRVVRDIALPTLDTTLPARPARPDVLRTLGERWNIANAVGRLTEALAEVAA
jgi:5'-3' exonuclease